MLYIVLLISLLTGWLFQDPEPVKITWHVVVLLLAGIYEVVARIIPTIGNYSWLAKLIDILKLISDFLNKRKKKK